MPKQKTYPYGILKAIESELPADVIDALSKHGWNAFGVYELVDKHLKANKHLKVKPGCLYSAQEEQCQL